MLMSKEAEAEIRRLEREKEALEALKAQTDAENKRMDELDTLSTGVPDRDESEPLEEAEDDKVRALLDDPAFTAQFRDLGEELQAGRIAAGAIHGGGHGAADLHGAAAARRRRPRGRPRCACRGHGRVPRHHRQVLDRGPRDGPQFRGTFAALNAILSGPPSSPEQRARWPRGITLDNADPVCTAKVIDEGWGEHRDTFVLAFESEEAARVWVWKMNYEVFYGEGASMHLCHNMSFGTFRLPENLHFLHYDPVLHRRLAGVRRRERPQAQRRQGPRRSLRGQRHPPRRRPDDGPAPARATSDLAPPERRGFVRDDAPGGDRAARAPHARLRPSTRRPTRTA